jgi:hypothetical protein
MLYFQIGNEEIYISILTTIMGLFFPSPLSSISSEVKSRSKKKHSTTHRKKHHRPKERDDDLFAPNEDMLPV